MRDTLELDQPYKQIESKMQVIGMIWSIKMKPMWLKMLKQVNQCKQKKRKWPT